MNFTARQLQEKCQEQNVHLYMTFVDLTKAFDTVSRDGLWKIIAKFGCPPRFIAMVQQFRDDIRTCIKRWGQTGLCYVTNTVQHDVCRSWMLFRTVTLVFQSGTVLMAIYSTLELYVRHGHGQHTTAVQRLNHFHVSCLRKLLKIKWQDKILDTDLLKKEGVQSMHTVLKLAQQRWTGHVIRTPNEQLPKKVFYGELQKGKRSQGGQKKRYKNTLKASLKDFDIPIWSWELQTTQERSKARSHQQCSSSL